MKSNTKSDIRNALLELCDAFNAHDLDRIMSWFADDCVLEMPKGKMPYGTRFAGKDSVRAGLASRFEGIPDVHYGNAEHFVDVEFATGISKWSLTGTGQDGKPLEVRGCDFYSFKNGKVVKKDAYWKIIEDDGATNYRPEKAT